MSGKIGDLTVPMENVRRVMKQFGDTMDGLDIAWTEPPREGFNCAEIGEHLVYENSDGTMFCSQCEVEKEEILPENGSDFVRDRIRFYVYGSLMEEPCT